MSAIHIGISGWRCPAWRDAFYPSGLAPSGELAYAAARFASIELGSAPHDPPRPGAYAAWRGSVPEGFVFAVRGSRLVTHVHRLQDVRTALADFFASGVLELREKLGPVLWQLPSSLEHDAEQMEQFLTLLPRDHAAAVALAQEAAVPARLLALTGEEPPRRLRHALEVRHSSFATPAFVEQVARHGVAVAVADGAGRGPPLEDLTADFVYVRLQGDADRHASGYGEVALAHWGRRLRAWSRGGQVADANLVGTVPALMAPAGREVFCYFDNDVKVRAPYDARQLAQILRLDAGLEPLEAFQPPARWEQGLGPRAKSRAPQFRRPAGPRAQVKH